MSISVRAGGEVVVIVPQHIHIEQAHIFVEKKREWIEKKVHIMQKYAKKEKLILTKKEIKELKEKTLLFVQEKLKQYNMSYGYKWNNVTIRGQKTRWGSCSRVGNLQFNYKIALLPAHLVDYIVVHELCHLGAFDHSSRFWNLVARTVPDYMQRRKELKYTGISLE